MNIQVQRMALCLSTLLFYLHIREVEAKGICLYVSAKSANWIDALNHCLKNGMCLAELDTSVALRQFTHHLSRAEFSDDGYWFGLNSMHKDTYRYVSSNKPAEFIPQGSKLVHNGSCAFLQYTDNSYEFASAGCQVHKKFICAHTPMCEGLNAEEKKDTCIITEEVRSIVAY